MSRAARSNRGGGSGGAGSLARLHHFLSPCIEVWLQAAENSPPPQDFHRGGLFLALVWRQTVWRSPPRPFQLVMSAWGRLLQLLGCLSALGATQLLRSSGSRAPPSPGTIAERGRSPVHACVQVWAAQGLGSQPRGTLEWIMGAAEAGARLWPSSGAEWIILWVFCLPAIALLGGKSHLHIAVKSPVLLGSGKLSSADFVCQNGSRCCFYQKS